MKKKECAECNFFDNSGGVLYCPYSETATEGVCSLSGRSVLHERSEIGNCGPGGNNHSYKK